MPYWTVPEHKAPEESLRGWAQQEDLVTSCYPLFPAILVGPSLLNETLVTAQGESERGGESLMYMVQQEMKATSRPPGVPGPAVGSQQHGSG